VKHHTTLFKESQEPFIKNFKIWSTKEAVLDSVTSANPSLGTSGNNGMHLAKHD
jgi:hypothetical protein